MLTAAVVRISEIDQKRACQQDVFQKSTSNWAGGIRRTRSRSVSSCSLSPGSVSMRASKNCSPVRDSQLGTWRVSQGVIVESKCLEWS